VTNYAISQHVPQMQAVHVTETVGKGISGSVEGKEYILSKVPHTTEDMTIGLYHHKQLLATFTFTDEVKTTSRSLIKKLQHMGLSLFILTGDKKTVTKNLVSQLG